jgi:hypothetical protein
MEQNTNQLIIPEASVGFSQLRTISENKWPKINLFRFNNVWFGETVRPYLMERGNNLMKVDLDVGKNGPRSLRNIAE